MKKIAIIGTGQLGSRHLQGLMSAKTEMNVWVIDQSIESLNIAKERCSQVNPLTPKIVSYAESIDALPPKLDLVIVATGSKPRAAIVKSLLEHSIVTYLVLEKFLFTRIQDFYDIDILLEKKGVKCWVNCPRRMWPVYDTIKQFINPNKPVFMLNEGNDWGMCCNSVHSIDLWMFLAGDSPFIVNMSEVEPEIKNSKRKGYIELLGKEIFLSENGDAMILGSYADYSGDSKRIILNDGNEIIVKEGEGKWFINGKEYKVNIPFQSGLTGILADEIFETGDCRLTPYKISVQYHEPYLKAVIDFVNKVQGVEHDSCPIT